MNNFILTYDKQYGIDKKSGYSISENGSMVLVFEKYLIIALIKWLVKRRKNERI